MAKRIQYVKTNALKGALLEWGFGQTDYGKVLLIMREAFLVGLFFAPEGEKVALRDMKIRFKEAAGFEENKKSALGFLQKIKKGESVAMVLVGSAFQHKVWQKLLDVPKGKTSTYGAIAAAIGNKKAGRAVGGALNKNKIAWLVPCHRILAGDKTLHGYRYGLAIKEKMLKQEGAL